MTARSIGMADMNRISDVIGEIYDAAIDRERWPAALERICAFVGGAASTLTSHDFREARARFHVSWSEAATSASLDAGGYAKINALIPAAVRQADVGEVSTYLDLISENETRDSHAFREWAEPQGYVDAVQATLEKSNTSFSAAVVIRHERNGPVDEPARRRMRLLAPHLRRAMVIGKVVEQQHVATRMLADTLDGLSAAMFLVDANAQIVHANASGQALMETGMPVARVRGRLAFRAAGPETSLRAAIAAVEGAFPGAGAETFTVPISAQDGMEWMVHVLPLTRGERRSAGARYAATAAIFIRKADISLAGPIAALKDAYQLTPAERRVLTAIVEVGGVPEVAATLGVSETTVKTHLRRLFEKTGATRQADLVKLVAAHASPLLS